MPTHAASPQPPALAALMHQVQSHRPVPNGGIIVAGTPIGNAGDVTLRLLDALLSADVIAAEDTRRVRTLASNVGVELRAKVVSNFDHNESHRARSLVDAAASGARVLVVSDAGMPAVSDPGFEVVRLARAEGVEVTCLPGPSAVTTALTVSGIAMGHFRFLGFAPRKDGARRTFFQQFDATAEAVCFFESPHRLAASLEVAAEVLGQQREAAVCRELTKTYEEVRRGGLAELARWAEEGVKGEIAVVVAPAEQKEAQLDVGEAAQLVEELVQGGARLKDAAGEVAQRHGLRKREVYEEVLRQRG